MRSTTRVLLLATAALHAGHDAARAFPRPAAPPLSRPAAHALAAVPSSGGRRAFLRRLPGAAALVAGGGGAARALDFDSFERGEIAADTARCDPKRDPKCVPKLTTDEALCQYGGGGKARGEACRRVKEAGGKMPEAKKEKSLGGAYAM